MLTMLQTVMLIKSESYIAGRPVPSISLPALPPELHSGAEDQAKTSGSSRLSLILALGITVTVTALVLLFLLLVLIRKKKRELMKPKSPMVGVALWNKDLILSPNNPLKNQKGSLANFRRFKYKEIEKATDEFTTVIGKGGFGTVYKAHFQDGLVVAVKRMHRVSRQGEQDYCKEMEFLGRLHHRHLVTLKGFCIEKHERFLIYEYMENGSLKEHLHGDIKTQLDWPTRMQIALNVAAALEYLHCYCDPPLCHRDIKSSNILLGEKFLAKVADFGLAHEAPSADSSRKHVSTDVRGTPGYLDPEYVSTQQLTEKSDIYSYGVLLLELITGRGAVQENKNLVEWAQPFLVSESRILHMLDPELENTCNIQELQWMAVLVKMCTQKEGKLRPTIRQILRFLHDKLDMDRVSALQRMPVVVSETSYDKGSSLYLSISDEVASLSSTFTPNTPLSQCSKSFRFDTTPPISPVSDQS